MLGKVCHFLFFQKLLERILRICKVVIKANGSLTDENKIWCFYMIIFFFSKCLFFIKIKANTLLSLLLIFLISYHKLQHTSQFFKPEKISAKINLDLYGKAKIQPRFFLKKCYVYPKIFVSCVRIYINK